MPGRPGKGSDPTDEILTALSRVPVFRSVDHRALRQAASASRVVDVSAGQTLIRHGEPGDAFFVVHRGLLEVLDGADKVKRIRLLRAGSSFGELALLSDEPRTGTVRAVRDTVVWQLPRSAFQALLDKDGDFARAMVRSLTELIFESRSQPDSDRLFAARVFAIVPVGDDVFAGSVIAGFVRRLGAEQSHICSQPVETDESVWGRTVEALEQEYQFVFLLASSERDAWFQFCVREADRVVVVGYADGDFIALENATGPDLVIFGRARDGAVHRALVAISPRSRHLVAADAPDQSIDCAVRRMTGRALGVVLSGGGARGLAHIGVLQALEDAGVTVDRFGGTSIGALVGALAAQGRSPASIGRMLRRELVDRRPFADYGIPRVALIRARRAREMLDALFGSTRIEDLPFDFFCISADLVSADAVVHRTGPLTEAVGASMSLPGLAPPVRLDERILVDGGVLDNLPVEEMVASGEGPIIAVDVLGRGVLGRNRRSRYGRESGLPTLVETLARSATLASRHKAESSRRLATHTIVPNLTDVGLLDFARFDEILAAGAATDALASWAIGDVDPALVPGPNRLGL
jgi:NTE family protein